MSSRAVTKETFERDVLASEQPVIVDFWAPWCGPCRAVAPVLERIAAERRDELRVVKVNIDEEPELAVRYGVSSIPTIMLFASGTPISGTVGARNKAQLEKALGLAPPPGTLEPAAKQGGVRGFIARLAGSRI